MTWSWTICLESTDRQTNFKQAAIKGVDIPWGVLYLTRIFNYEENVSTNGGKHFGE